MTNAEKKAVLLKKLDQAYEALGQYSPESEEFARVLSAVGLLETHILYGLKDEEEPPKLPGPKLVEIPAAADPSVADGDSSPSQEEPAAEAPTLSKDEVRKELSALQNSSGVDIAAVMQELGFARLSEVPAERYAELLDAARAKVS